MKCITILMMMLQRVKFGEKCRFYGVPVIVKSKEGRIVLGKGVRIRSSTLSNLIGLYQRTIIITKGKGSIEIGDDVGMSGVTIYARDSIRIGKGCLIGANTKILDNDFHPVDPEIRRVSPGAQIPTKPVEIGNNVFIGCNSLVLKGSVIGDNTTIGAGSVVTGKIPANCIAAGNPAKMIKRI